MPKKPVLSTSQKPDSRQKLDRETNKILRLKEQIAKNFWDLGTSLCLVHDEELYHVSGQKTFIEYLKQVVKIGRSTAYRLMELSRNFSRETASRFGQEKLLGAIAYAKATPEQDLPIDVTRYEIEVKSPSGKKIKKSFKKATGKEIKNAAARIRRKPKSHKLLSPNPLSFLADGLDGKKPRLNIAPFLAQARENLKEISPRPKLAVTSIKEGNDPLIDLHLSNVHASRLTEVFGLLTGAALEVWMENLRR